jgi:hypothetical protein
MLVKNATLRLIGINMAIDRLMADRHFGGDLFRAPLALQISLGR